MDELQDVVTNAANHRRIPKLLGGLLVSAATLWAAGGIAMGQPVEGTLGRVEGASDVRSLGTSATGTIAELFVHVGDHVVAGQHLVRVECGNIERELDARKSDLAAAEAVLSRVVNGPRPEEVTIGIANVNLAEARSLEAQKVLQRTMQLHEGFTVTRVQIDIAERDAHIAAAQLDEVRAKLALLKAGSRQEDIDEARGRRDAAKGRVEEAATRLSYCVVQAPTAGTILSTNINAGQFVSMMAPVTLLTMVDDSRRRVRAFVDEREASKLCVRQHARVTADGIPSLQADGVVDSIGAAVGESPFAANGARQFREVMLSLPDKLPDNAPQMPLGLRVGVQFTPCPAPQKATGK
jgi:HlyD family secretion protein